jgi:hypothetical protein
MRRMPKSTPAAPDLGKSTPSASGPKKRWHTWMAWSGFKTRVPVLVLCAWFLLYAGRPFSLGFYGDDWDAYLESLQRTRAFSIERFQHFIGIGTVYTSRPLAGIFGFAISSIAGENPFAFQLVCALLALGAALSLRAWLKTLLPKLSEAHPVAADLAAIIWLAAPWSVVATAWPTCTMAVLPAQIFFTEAARRMMPGPARERKRLLIFATLLLASYLCYETFYLQAFLLAGFYWFREGRGSSPWHNKLILTIGFVQGICLALNRVIAHLGWGVYKTFAPDWIALSWLALKDLPGDLFRSADSFGQIWIVLFGITVLSAISATVLAVSNSKGRSLAGGLGVITLSLTTIPVFCLIYALAGYRIAFTGLISRTLAGVSWSAAVLLYGLLSVILLARPRVIAVIGTAAAVLFVMVSGMAQQIHVAELAKVWQREKAILARAPVEKIRALPKDLQTNILYIGPSYDKDLPIFGAVWELTGAVFSLPELRGWLDPDQRIVNIHPATELYDWSWDGADLTQDNPGYWQRKVPGKALYIWNYNDGALVLAEAGFHWDGRSNPERVQSSSGVAAPASATLLRIDTQTQGNWNGVYGGDGFVIPADPPKVPEYAEVQLADATLNVWAPSTQNVDAPQPELEPAAWWTPLVQALGTQDRRLSCWWSASSFSIDVNLKDGQVHRVALYLLDWASGGARAEEIRVLDVANGAALDTHAISHFNKGQYLVWNLRGHVRIQVTRTAGANSVASGLFFQ